VQSFPFAVGGPGGTPAACAEHSIEIEANAAKTAATAHFTFKDLLMVDLPVVSCGLVPAAKGLAAKKLGVLLSLKSDYVT
jgi:hypothetical protein